MSLRYTPRAFVDDPTLGWSTLRAGDVLAAGDVALGAYGRRDIRRGIESGRFRFDDLELTCTMIGGGAEALLRRRLEGTLPEPPAGGGVAGPPGARNRQRIQSKSGQVGEDIPGGTAPSPAVEHRRLGVTLRRSGVLSAALQAP